MAVNYVERKKKNGKPSSWQAQIRHGKAKAKCKTFATLEKAEQWVASVEPKIHAAYLAQLQKKPGRPKAQGYADFLDQPITDILNDFLVSGLQVKKHSGNAPTIIHYVKNTRVKDINTAWTKDYIEELRASNTCAGRQFAYSTIVAHLKVVAQVVRWRADELDVPRPNMRMHLKKLLPKGWDTQRERRFEEGEEERLLQTLGRIQAPSARQWQLLVKLAVETAARLQEVLMIEWREVNLQKRIWNIPAIRTKAKEARTVPLSRAATSIFLELQALRVPGCARAFTLLGKPDSVSASFHQYSLRANLVDFRFHDLRHEAISRMMDKRGLRESDIMGISGHKDWLTFQIYVNQRKADLVDAME